MTEKLYDQRGRRKYLTKGERKAFLAAAAQEKPEIRTFCNVLAYTGCRISEALALKPESIDQANGVIVYTSLKKRGRLHFRAVPIPKTLQKLLVQVHGLEAQGAQPKATKLWSWTRVTAWRHVKKVLKKARLEGPHATPKGLRHGFGVAAISSGVPLNLVQRWLGHAHMSTTAIYTHAIGDEERQIASRMWQPL